MRRLFSVALIGFAVAAASSAASAQGTAQPRPDARVGGRGGRAAMDTARMRRMDSVRVARGDTARRGRGDAGLAMGRFGLAGIQLTESEKADLKAINRKYADEMKQLRPAKGQPRVAPSPEARAKMQDLMTRQRADIRAALTPEHQAQFDANVAKGRGGHGKDAKGNRAAGGRGRGHRPPPSIR